MDVPLGCLLLVLVTAALLPLPSPTLSILAVLAIAKVKKTKFLIANLITNRMHCNWLLINY
jgi:hypothetical protein